MNGRRPHASEDGFSLVEVLIALGILGMALLALIPMFVLAVHGNANSGDLTFATNLVQEKATELRTLDYDDLNPGADQDMVKLRSMYYRRAWLVEQDTPHAGMKRITVSAEPSRASRPTA